MSQHEPEQEALPTAAANRPSPNALSDEQLTWEQFMDANHLLCRWLIPAGWTEGYAKVLTSFFWQIENHEDKRHCRGQGEPPAVPSSCMQSMA
jgi:hypothetical protein